MKRGRSLEKLVLYLESILSQQKNVKVESPKRLRDQITGQLREFDVVLTMQQHHHELVIAIECRDRSRPTTVNQVESFWAKCQHTNINKGIIVSSCGFRKNARNKALQLGIQCLDIEGVESLDWIQTSGVISRTRNIRHVHWLIELEVDNETPSHYRLISTPDNTEIDIATLNKNLGSALMTIPITDEELNGIQYKHIGITNVNDLLVRDMETNTDYPIRVWRAHIEYTVEEYITPFQLVIYRENNTNVPIASSAIANINIPNLNINLLLLQDQQTGNIKFGGFAEDGTPFNMTIEKPE